MAPINLQVRYRPIKIGWCVREGDLAEFRNSLRLTHVFWGGRYNPIIPLGNLELARRLVKTFRVDCLYFASNSSEGTALRNEFKHLLWPTFPEELFMEGLHGRVPTFLDIYHPIKHLYTDHIEGRETPKWKSAIFQWLGADPLADVLLATVGAYPDKDDVGIDYDAFFRKYLSAEEIKISSEDSLLANSFEEFTPTKLTGLDLRLIGPNWGRDTHGLYYGVSGNFTDLVNYWNLRASGIEVYFYDPSFHSRLVELAKAFVARLRTLRSYSNDIESVPSVWHRLPYEQVDLNPFGEQLIQHSITLETWNGLNVRPGIAGFEEKSVLGTLSGSGKDSVTFELPQKPFFDDEVASMQHVMVSIHPLVSFGAILKPPYLPRLNEYYGRNFYHDYNAVRSEEGGIGIVTKLTTSNLTVHALEVRGLVEEIFKTFGILAKPSPAGLLGARLINQMGGLQGSRVFKISGVRELIRTHSPEQSFTRSGAVTTIRQYDQTSGKAGFSAYESLYIEARKGGQLKPEDAFLYLLKKGVFRVGLRLICPNCELENWIHLDAARTMSRCEYCGNDFDISPQLKDRDWAYRRSGLFGRNDHQGGGIPVALTLQQLDAILHERMLAYTTGTELEPITANIRKCETDFIVLTESMRDKSFMMAIGECKGNMEIEADDVDKLRLVADVVEEVQSVQTFIVFSKIGTFSPQEVERCKLAQGLHRRRLILLSERELEPYFVYERAGKEFDIRTSAISLEDMAEATHHIYFAPRKKAPSVPTTSTPNEGPSAP